MTKLEVQRINGRYPAERIAETYNQYGIVVLKGYLSAEGRDELRACLDRRLEEARPKGGVIKFEAYPDADFLLGDILAVRELEPVNYIFFGQELLDIARTALQSDELLYWGDSSIQFGEAARGFHKDNVERLDGAHDDWKGSYGLIRCGFYFQDHTNHSGGLKVRLASQNTASHLKGPIADISSTYGDLVLWSMRLTHSGNNRKLKSFLRLPLHPRLEAIAPRALILPEQLRRISAFCAFGRPGSHADHYIKNMNRRDADYRPYFQRARAADVTISLLKRYGLSFIKPNDYYGELDQ